MCPNGLINFYQIKKWHEKKIIINQKSILPIAHSYFSHSNWPNEHQIRGYITQRIFCRKLLLWFKLIYTGWLLLSNCSRGCVGLHSKKNRAFCCLPDTKYFLCHHPDSLKPFFWGADFSPKGYWDYSYCFWCHCDRDFKY